MFIAARKFHAMVVALLGGSLCTLSSVRNDMKATTQSAQVVSPIPVADGCRVPAACHTRKGSRMGEYGCTNRIVVNHKHGWMMVLKDIIDNHFANQTDGVGVKRILNEETPWFEDPERQPIYREAVVTRNFVDAILSGYQYHQSGKECGPKYAEMNPKPITLPAHPGWIFNLTQPETQALAASSKNTKSLCRYLEAELPSVEDTMRVYMDYAINTWYQEHIDYAKKVQDMGNSLFICYSDLYGSSTRRATLEKMKRWFSDDYDNQHPTPIESGPSQASACGRIPKSSYYFEDWEFKKGEYRGDHATDHSDTEKRTHLKNLIRELDQKHFGGKLQKANDYFGCPELA